MSFFFYFCLWNILNVAVKASGLSLLGFQLLTYISLILSNPGTPSKEYWIENFDNSVTKVTNYRICQHCQIVMDLDKGTEHCIDCNVCVEGLDHHCPWSSKCIGRKNLKLFYLFLGSTCFLFVFLMISLFTISSLYESNYDTK